MRVPGWLALVVIALLGPYATAGAATQTGSWRTIAVEDEWGAPTGKAAVSPWLSSSHKMSFPYHDVRARLVVEGCRDVSIAFTKPPNLIDGMISRGFKLRSSYRRLLRVRAKWNDRTEFGVKARQDVGGREIHFSDRIKLPQITSNQTLSVTLNWYGQGQVAWRFPLDGSSEALADAGCR